MAGFGQTAEQQKEGKKATTKATVKATVKVDTADPFSALRNEEQKIAGHKELTHQFIGIVGHDGTGKSGIVLDSFMDDPNRNGEEELHCLDFDMGAQLLSSSLHDSNDKIITWNPWAMGITDRTAYDYPSTHQRVMTVMKYIHHEITHNDKQVWGVLISGVDSWLEICTNNMRIIDLGLARDGIEAADTRGAGEAKKVERQSDWAIRNTRFHQLTALSRDLVRLGVRVFWETHLRVTDFYSTNKSWQPEWEKKTNNYLPTIIWMEKDVEEDDEGNVVSTTYNARFGKCKTNPELQDQKRKVFVTKTGESPEWYGLPELYDGSL